MTSDVPSWAERRVEAVTAPRDGVEVDRIEQEQVDDSGEVYRIVIDDPDAEDGTNPSFFAEAPTSAATGQDVDREMFGSRVEAGVRRVMREVLGIEVDEETYADEIDPDHPAATGEDVDYGPGPTPDTSGVRESYDDGLVRVQSTTEADIPKADDTNDVDQAADQSTQTTSQDDTTNDTTSKSSESMSDSDTSLPDDFYGQIAETALDARDLDEKGHDTAVEALLREIENEIEDHIGGDD